MEVNPLCNTYMVSNWPITVDNLGLMEQNETIPDSKVHGANMGPILGRQDPDGPHVGPMNFAIWDCIEKTL